MKTMPIDVERARTASDTTADAARRGATWLSAGGVVGAAASGACCKCSRSMGVSVMPGHTQLHRKPIAA